MDTFLREGSQDQDMGTGGGEGRHPSHAETQPRSLLDGSFSKPPAPSQLLAQMPTLLAPSTSCGEEGGEDAGNGGTLCLWVPCPGELLTQPALKFQPEAGGQEARVQAGEQLCPSPPLLTLCPTPAPHMRLQLLARSLCISPSFPLPRSGLPAS